MTYTVYILRTSGNTLYVGQTNNLARRIKEHLNKSASSAKYIKYFKTSKLVYSEEFETRSLAMKREYELKQWTRDKKEALISGSLTDN